MKAKYRKVPLEVYTFAISLSANNLSKINALKVMEIFLRLVPERLFSFHKLSKNKKPEIVNVLCPRDIKVLRYFGVLIIVFGGHARSISFAPHAASIIGTASSASI